MAKKDIPTECPLCGQTLVNEAAVRKLRRREAELEDRYRAEAAAAVEQRLVVERAELERQIRSEHDQRERVRERAMVALHHRNEEIERRLQSWMATCNHRRGARGALVIQGAIAGTVPSMAPRGTKQALTQQNL